jgi:site-specific DNA-cytosine methylase
MDNSNKIILDLCGGTGGWSKPYKDNGYDVRLITLPDYDVMNYVPPNNVYGILAAPPCTHFSIACNRLWNEKDVNGKTIEGLSVLVACLKIISLSNPRFWALENPVGRMKRFLGPAQFIFEQTDFGFPCKKKTLLWGNFNIPEKRKYEFEQIYKLEEIDYKMKSLNKQNMIETDHSKRAALRSVTPSGFALAFYKANR